MLCSIIEIKLILHRSNNEDSSQYNNEFEIEYSKAIWLYISSATSPDFFIKNKVIFECNSKTYASKLEIDEIKKAIKEERNFWISFIKEQRLNSTQFLKDNKNELLKNMKDSVNQGLLGNPPLSIRSDILIHYLFNIILDSSRNKTPYNPESNRNKNDGLDFLLGYSFIIPALLCTGDYTLKNRLKDLKSYQNNWVYSPEEIAQAWEDNILQKPKFSDS